MFAKRHPPVGSRPGTLVLPEDSPPPRISAMWYDEAELVERSDLSVKEVAELVARPGGVTWVDVQGLGDEAVLQDLAGLFMIHALALEDVVNAPQRPKTESFDDHQLYLTQMVTSGVGRGPGRIEQVSIFVGSNHVLTFQEHVGDVLDPLRKRIRAGGWRLRTMGAEYLGYAIIDNIIDHYYPIIETISEKLVSLEDRVLLDPNPELLSSINALRRSLLQLRRGIAPQRESLNALLRGESRFLSEASHPYLRDAYDHVIQITEAIDTSRELASGLFKTYLSVVANRQNEVMKVLTIMASIFIPLGFLAGVYGMNFQFMPELSLRWGYPALLGVMAVAAGGMLVFFRRKGWLGELETDDHE
jgi:magnesium transporter